MDVDDEVEGRENNAESAFIEIEDRIVLPRRREDPLGFPSTRNLTIDEIEKLANIEIENPRGFVYDNSSVWSKRSVLFAHTSYWSARKTFANAVVKAFSNGYRLQYDKEFQQKVLENNKRKIKFEMY